jgi:polyisoprenoid-binding protein YceI
MLSRMTRTYEIDTSHSHIGFSVRHLVIAKVRGEFPSWKGTIELDEAEPVKSTVKVEIDVASLSTREEKRDAHLRSADFFDVENFPKMTFESEKVLVENGKVTGVVGNLTIRGTTKQVVLHVNDEGRARDPWGGERAAFSATVRINRQDFGLKWNAALETGGVLVGDNVDINLEIEALAKAAQAAA